MKRLNSDALLVYARIYTHQRFYFVNEEHGYYRDAHKGDELKPIPPREWQALCDVINDGYSALKPNICRVVEGKSYMQAMAEKSKDNGIELVPFTSEEMKFLKSAPHKYFYIALKNNQYGGTFFKAGSSHNPFIDVNYKEEELLRNLIRRQVMSLGDVSDLSDTSIIRTIHVRGK